MDIEEKIRTYYFLKKAIDIAQTRLNQLNKEIKKELNPGEHVVGGYKATITLKRKYDYDFWPLPDHIYDRCIKDPEIDPAYVEQEYIDGNISDELMKKIRGEAKIIPSLTVERDDV